MDLDDGDSSMDKQKKVLNDIEYEEDIEYMDEFSSDFYYGYNNIKGPSSQNRKLSIKFKLDAIKRAELIGNRAASRELKVSERSIRYWRNNKSNYEKITNKKSKITLHKGKIGKDDIEWDKISEYIDEKCKKGIPVTTENIFMHILKIYPQHHFTTTKHALYKRIYRFLKRSN